MFEHGHLFCHVFSAAQYGKPAGGRGLCALLRADADCPSSLDTADGSLRFMESYLSPVILLSVSGSVFAYVLVGCWSSMWVVSGDGLGSRALRPALRRTATRCPIFIATWECGAAVEESAEAEELPSYLRTSSETTRSRALPVPRWPQGHHEAVGPLALHWLATAWHHHLSAHHFPHGRCFPVASRLGAICILSAVALVA